MAEAAFNYFNTEDLPSLPVAVQADSLKAWSRLESKRAAAEAGLVAAFWAADGPAADGQKSMAAWLMRFARCTKPAAKAMVAASHRLREHRHIDRALTEGVITASYGRWIADVTKRFDPADRDTVEEILVTAAGSGALVEDLEKVATAALRRLQPDGVEQDEARAHADRGLTLSKTFGGAGRLNGDLDAEATALAETVIEALAVKAGPEDDRTARQRRHDALAEAFRRLLGSNLLPERGGAKPHIKVDMDLATLRRLPGSKQLEDVWVEQRLAALTRSRTHGTTTRELLADLPVQQLPLGLARPDAQALEQMGAARDTADHNAAGHDGVQQMLPGPADGAVLAGVGPISDHLAAALACDSTLTPIVAAAVDHGALTAMTNEWLRAHGLCGRLACAADGATDEDSGCDCGLKHGLTVDAHARLWETLLHWAIRVLSGPGGLASYLRTGLLDGPLATSSIVLDVGTGDKTVPTPLERAVRRRDKRCRFPGCDHPAELSQVHHMLPRSEGGPTELWNLISTCSWHHLLAIHTWGWQLRLNPDGTTTATGPDGRVHHEIDPPGDPPRQAA